MHISRAYATMSVSDPNLLRFAVAVHAGASYL